MAPRAPPDATSQVPDFDAKNSVTPLHYDKTQNPSAIRIREHHGLGGIELEDMRAQPTAEPLATSSSTVAVKLDPNSTLGSNMSIRDERVYLATLSYNLATAGWNDGTLGPLLPRIQEHYQIGYTVVSILFVVSCVGFIAGAFSNVYLSERLGFGKTITLAAAAQILAYTTMAVAPPYPVFCLALFFNGWALSLQVRPAIIQPCYQSCYGFWRASNFRTLDPTHSSRPFRETRR